MRGAHYMNTQNIDSIKSDADTPETSGKPMREVSVEGCELLGKGGNGAVYRLDEETIVKVYGR